MLLPKMIMHISNRQHLKHPIPFPMETTPIGKALSVAEWNKFCSRHLFDKQTEYCQRRMDGSMSFIGERGLDALIQFQLKFKDRFHLRMCCNDLPHALEGIALATRKGLSIAELRYKNGNHQPTVLQASTQILSWAKSH